jgi:hypothetical protein
MSVDPFMPHDAQRIVADYLTVVDAHAAADVYPCAAGELPHSKQTIRAAFKTSVVTLASAGQLTDEMREYLEVGYISLADYVDDESAALLREYTHAGEELAADRRLAKEKVATDAWRRVSEQSRLAGALARTISEEAERLRTEFRSWSSATAAAS